VTLADTEFIEVPADLKERMQRYREEHDGEPLGNVADRILFEDDRVRIWEMKLEPGEASDLHRHDHDYYLVMLQGDLIGGIPPKSVDADPYVAKLPPGGVTVPVKKGDTEWAMNVGKETFYEILVELK
jgi:hypothetical protein